MNIKDILESKEALAELLGKEMPLSVAVKVSKLQKELNEVLDIYNSRRKTLFDKYGEPIEDGEMRIKDEHIKEYVLEHDKLLLDEIDITITPINADTLGNISIKPDHLTKLSWLLECN